MKKIILILISILIATPILLLFISSSNDYAAEKLFYRAGHIYGMMAVNPDVAPPKMLASVENILKKVIQRYPNAAIRPLVYTRLAEVYIAHEKYDNAIILLNDLIKAYSDNNMILSRAHFLKGVTYEKWDKWSEALAEFSILKDKYIATPLGLEVPLYIARHYALEGQEEKAKNAYNEAAAFYQDIEKEYRSKIFGFTVSKYLMQAYISVGDFEKAGEAVENTIKNYLSPAALMQYLPYVEAIFVTTLKKPEKAVEIYKFVIENAKNPQLKDALQKRIEMLQEGKTE